MPNWAFGEVKVSGRKKDVRKFIEDCFVWGYDDNPNKDPEIKYFARSFINDKYDNLFSRFENELSNIGIEEKCIFDINVEFAWSAHACTIDGYPQDYRNECIDLQTACKKYKVEVQIWTEEQGMCFEENIICDENGDIVLDYTQEMESYVCLNCGNEQCFSSREEEFICYECDVSGIENWVS